MNRISIILSLLIFISFNSLAQEKEEKEQPWDVSNPNGNWDFKELNISTNEGTWMNLDVSPDGKTIVFDMLGDIYKMDVNGGKATVLRE